MVLVEPSVSESGSGLSKEQIAPMFPLTEKKSTNVLQKNNFQTCFSCTIQETTSFILIHWHMKNTSFQRNGLAVKINTNSIIWFFSQSSHIGRWYVKHIATAWGGHRHRAPFLPLLSSIIWLDNNISWKYTYTSNY